MLDPLEIIERLNLEPLLPEGGYFRQTYLSSELIPTSVLPSRYKKAKPFSSVIYYLLHGDEFSALHRLPTDEVYHFYLGDPVEMLLLLPGGESRKVIIGSDIERGESVQVLAPRAAWQGSRLRPGGRFALMGTTMAPAYGPEDFELGERAELIRQYPHEERLIRALTALG